MTFSNKNQNWWNPLWIINLQSKTNIVQTFDLLFCSAFKKAKAALYISSLKKKKLRFILNLVIITNYVKVKLGLKFQAFPKNLTSMLGSVGFEEGGTTTSSEQNTINSEFKLET